MFIGIGTDFWGNSIYVHPENYNRIDSEFIPLFLKLLPVILSFFGVILSFYFYTYNSKFLYKLKISKNGIKLYNFINRKWFFDKIYNEYFSQFFLRFGYSVTYKIIDRGAFEVFGPKGLSTVVSLKSKYLSNLQTEYIYHYTFLMLFDVHLPKMSNQTT
jgi:NADH-ubiquinone oxidoreductase chain 5